MRILISFLIALQVAGIVASTYGAVTEIQTIGATGPASGLLGLLIATLCYWNDRQLGFLFGLSVLTIAVLCFAAIYGLTLSPDEAQFPLGLLICVSAVLVVPLGVTAILDVWLADLSRRPIRLRFGVAELLGFTFVVSVFLGMLRSGREVGVAIGILISFGAVAGFVVHKFYAGRAEFRGGNPFKA